MKTVYKLVSVDSDVSLHSLIVTGKLRLTYAVGKWTKPEIGKILAFGTLDSAKNFYQGWGHCKIFLCEAVGVGPKRWLYNTHNLYLLRRFWSRSDVEIDHRRMDKNISPDGTVACSRLKLVREIVL